MAKKSETPVQLQPPSVGRQVMLGALGVAAITEAGLYFAGIVSEAIVGISLATALATVAGLYMFTAVVDTIASGWQRAATAALVVAICAMAVIPVIFSAFPGTPLASGTVEQPGDSVVLPAATEGRVRLFVQGHIAGNGAGRLEASFGGLEKPTTAVFERRMNTVRVGRRGSGTAVHETSAEFVSAVVPRGQRQVTLERLDGASTGPLHVDIYRDVWPLRSDLVVGGILLALAAILAVRLKQSSGFVAAVGATLAFGAAAYDMVTPGSVIRPEIGAMIVGGFLGVAVGGLASWLARVTLSNVLCPTPAQPPHQG